MAAYFARPRAEILPYLPEPCARLLDIGCGEGATLEAVQSVRDVAWAGGLEAHGPSAARARARFDRVWEGDAERLHPEAEIPADSLDAILCLDVLEHLVDPWALVRRLSPLLRPKGRLIVSLPNIRHWKFVWRLAVRGDFRYRDAGLLDRTHLRFFTRDTGAELATAGGLRLVLARNATSYRPTEVRAWLSGASFGRLEPLLAKQFLFVAERDALRAPEAA
ncbi:MAG: class I SAM-dependent methyltransferase [Paracoccaceae bacterium]